MKPDAPSERGVQLEEFQRKHRTGLVTLVLTDLVDSVAVRRKLDDQAGASLLQAHRQLVRLKCFFQVKPSPASPD